MSACGYVLDAELDAEQRERLREYVTPRRALDGSLVYPLDEIDAVALGVLHERRRLADDRDDEDDDPPSPAPPGASSPQASRDLLAHYRERAATATDPVARATARRQLAALERTTSGRPAEQPAKLSRWAHVPLAALFEQAGNRIYERSNGRFECGHEPAHGSKSGRCVLIDPALGRWYCRSCRCGGDAVAALMSLRGWVYRQAAEWLAAQFGPPAAAAARPATRRRTLVWREVQL